MSHRKLFDPLAVALVGALGTITASALHAKPIAFADGTTTMHERNTNMLETQAFYAPTYWWSAGPGYLRLTSDDKQKEREISYVQANALIKRWNMPAAQANLFAYGGVGSAKSSENAGRSVTTDTVWRYGLQGDYETRKVYTSLKMDGYKSAVFSHRISTLQLGVAPYEHDYEDLATWFVLQLRHYTGGIRDVNANKIEQTALIRLFKGPVWVELGINRERHTQFMIMTNF